MASAPNRLADLVTSASRPAFMALRKPLEGAANAAAAAPGVAAPVPATTPSAAGISISLSPHMLATASSTPGGGAAGVVRSACDIGSTHSSVYSPSFAPPTCGSARSVAALHQRLSPAAANNNTNTVINIPSMATPTASPGLGGASAKGGAESGIAALAAVATGAAAASASASTSSSSGGGIGKAVLQSLGNVAVVLGVLALAAMAWKMVSLQRRLRDLEFNPVVDEITVKTLVRSQVRAQMQEEGVPKINDAIKALSDSLREEARRSQAALEARLATMSDRLSEEVSANMLEVETMMSRAWALQPTTTTTTTPTSGAGAAATTSSASSAPIEQPQQQQDSPAPSSAPTSEAATVVAPTAEETIEGEAAATVAAAAPAPASPSASQVADDADVPVPASHDTPRSTRSDRSGGSKKPTAKVTATKRRSTTAVLEDV